MRVASRFMLPTEILLGWLTIVAGIAGGWGDGRLHQLLALRGECTLWAALFIGIGTAKIACASIEWFLLRDSAPKVIMLSTQARSIIAFLGTILWAATAGWLVADGLFNHAPGLLLLAPIATIFDAWAFWENKKVTYAINPEHPTSRLVFHR